MNHRQHSTYTTYLRTLADLMGLKDWEITLSWDYSDDDSAAAMCHTTYGRKTALIRFGVAWWDNDPETQRYYCVHELLHCHTTPMHTALCNAQGRLGADAYEVLKGTHGDALEYAVDGIGVAFAKFLPLPPLLEDEDPPANVTPLPVRDAA